MRRLRKRTAVFLTVGYLCLNNLTVFANFGDAALQYGSYGNDVIVLQQKLNSLGYWCEADGVFGGWTQKKVQAFQHDYGIKETGIAGQATARRLIELTGGNAKTQYDRNTVITVAKKCLGIPYVWGGTTTQGFDCSGFTQYVMRENGIVIPRTAALQFGEGKPVTQSNLRPGDLVFFTTYKPGASHVGFYIGNHEFIHASSVAGEVTISSLQSDYYHTRYIGARRYN